jgi:sarcosine oxidase
VAHVVVVGGGVMGSAAAWQLASGGYEVTLLERFGPGHTEGSSHGSSRVFRLAYPDPFYVALAARALPLWRRLEEESGRALLTLTGALDHGPRSATEALRDAMAAAGHPGRELDAARAAERWPGLRFDASVLFHAGGGRVHADHAVLAFQEAAAAKGAVIRHRTRAERLLRHGASRVKVVTGSGETVAAEAAVVAVGGWTASLAPGLPAGFVSGPAALPALRVTQEQPLHFPASDPPAWPSFIHHPGAGLPGADVVYGLGSPDGVKAAFHGVGPRVDPDDRDRATDPQAVRRLQEYAERWLPGVDAATPVADTCLYTFTPDEDFVIDRDGPVTVLAGFSGHGFKFAPVVGELAAGLVAGRPAPRRFALGRRTAGGPAV